jgi:hypothetical protein
MKRTIIIIAALAALVAPAAAQAATHHATVIALYPVAHHGCTQWAQPSTDSWIVKCGGGTGGYVTYVRYFPHNAISGWMQTYAASPVSRTSWGRRWAVGDAVYQNIHVAAFSTVRISRLYWAWTT